MTQYRHSPRSVLRFISVFEKLLSLPKPTRITFSPTSLSMTTETGVARIRDAAWALIQGQVTHPNIDAKALATQWPLYKVTSLASGDVVIVPKAEKQTTPVAVANVLVGQPKDVLAVVKSEDEDAIRAFALLLSRRLLTGRVQIMGKLGEDLQNSLSAHDVALIEELGNTYLL